MNREERRRAARRAKPISWATEPPDLCPTATKIIHLVQSASDGWIVEHAPCDRCGLYTIVAHPGKEVFACLACGRHGQIDAATGVIGTHTAEGARLH